MPGLLFPAANVGVAKIMLCEAVRREETAWSRGMFIPQLVDRQP